MDLVIDTGVWKKATDNNNDLYLICVTIIGDLAIKSGDSLVLDVEEYIMSEYRKNIDSRFIEQVFCNLFSDNRIVKVSNKLDQRHKEKLIEMGFDLDDLPFVGTAMNSGKTIVTVDSDYGVSNKEKYRSEEDYKDKLKVMEYMRDKMNLKVYHAEEFVSITV